MGQKVVGQVRLGHDLAYVGIASQKLVSLTMVGPSSGTYGSSGSFIFKSVGRRGVNLSYIWSLPNCELVVNIRVTGGAEVASAGLFTHLSPGKGRRVDASLLEKTLAWRLEALLVSSCAIIVPTVKPWEWLT